MDVHALLADPAVLRWLFIGSAVGFVAVLIVIPVIVARLPVAYFRRPNRSRFPWSGRHPVVWVPLLVLKNALAMLCVAAGVLMLVLPGQGVLTIIVGVMLMDFPGKYRVERWLIMQPWLLRLFNRIRVLAGKAPFEVGDYAESGDS